MTEGKGGHKEKKGGKREDTKKDKGGHECVFVLLTTPGLSKDIQGTKKGKDDK